MRIDAVHKILARPTSKWAAAPKLPNPKAVRASLLERLESALSQRCPADLLALTVIVCCAERRPVMDESTAEARCEAQASTSSDTTLLELLMKQRSAGEHGIRLAFHNNLGQSICLENDPLLYCAITGQTALAVYLYQRGARKGHPLKLASFSSAGADGLTPWRKALKVSASHIARIAGHAATAEVMDNIERGTPLHWTSGNAHQWPDSFKAKVRPTIEACAQSPWFVALPGTARVAIMHELVSSTARHMFWGKLPEAVWQEEWEQVIDPAMLKAAAAVLLRRSSSTGSGSGKRASNPDEPEPRFPSYQIRISGHPIPAQQHRPGRLRSIVKHAARGAAGCLAIKLARQLGVSRMLPEGAMVFALGCAFPAPVMVLAAFLIKP